MSHILIDRSNSQSTKQKVLVAKSKSSMYGFLIPLSHRIALQYYKNICSCYMNVFAKISGSIFQLSYDCYYMCTTSNRMTFIFASAIIFCDGLSSFIIMFC